MTFTQFQESLSDYARDIKLNLQTVLTPEGAPGLTPSQIFGTALAAAYATRDKAVVEAISDASSAVLSDAEREAAKAAAVIMAMNNVYYRTLHHSDNAELTKLPARLRMNVIGKPGIAKVDFELYCTGVSAMNGCARCVNSHVAEVLKNGVSIEGVQSAIRIAAVIQAAGQAHFVG